MPATIEMVNKCESEIFDCTTPIPTTIPTTFVGGMTGGMTGGCVGGVGMMGNGITGGEYGGYYPSWYSGQQQQFRTPYGTGIESGVYGTPKVSCYDDVVISGVSCRFPENLECFSQKLYSGIETTIPTTTTTTPFGVTGGFVGTPSVFDPTFFGIDMKESEFMCPRMKQLVEVTYEAIFDSGFNPIEFRGSRTGVFIGTTCLEGGVYPTTGFYPTNTTTFRGIPTTFASQLASYYDFKGPSYTMDITNSSGLIALENAFTAIRTGQCDHAIVCGISFPVGCFGGYESTVKVDVLPVVEGMSVIFLQKRNVTRRFYTKIVHSKVFGDMTMVRDGEMVSKILRDVYSECTVDPTMVNYMEVYGPKSIGMCEYKQFCDIYTTRGRTVPLHWGSTCSFYGYPEPTYGFFALVKMLVSIQRGVVPSSMPITEFPMNEEFMRYMSVNTKLPTGLMALSSFGYPCKNVHFVFEPNCDYVLPTVNKVGPVSSFWTQDLTEMSRQPRLFNFSSQTEEGLMRVFEQMHQYPQDMATHFLLHPNAMTTPVTHPYRGFTILNSNNPIREVKKIVVEKRPVFFLFNGIGTQWSGMGRDLMQVEYFRTSIGRIHEVLKPFGVDLLSLIKGEKMYERTLHTMLGVVAIQMALVDCLKVLGVEADGMIGYSFSELVAAYCDGCLTFEEAIMAAYYHGKIVEESGLTGGSMATIGLSWDECIRQCPPSVVPVVHYATDLVTVSGPRREIREFVEQLKMRSIFAKEIETTGVAFHSYLMSPIVPTLRTALEKIIRTPKLRSSRWFTTVFPEHKWDTEVSRYFSPEYYINNVVSPCYFREAIRRVPTNAIVIEIAPHSFMQPIFVKNMIDKVTYINLMRRDVPSPVEHFWYSLGRLYNEGINVDTIKLFSCQPREQSYYPVPARTRFLSPFVSRTTGTFNYPVVPRTESTTIGQTLFGDCPFNKSYTYEIDTRDSEFSFLSGYKLDGRVVYPTSGYLYLVWKSLATMRNCTITELPVVFEHVKFHCPTVFTTEKCILTVSFVHLSGKRFEVYENRTLVACGHVYVPEREITEIMPTTMTTIPTIGGEFTTTPRSVEYMEQEEIYKEFKMRGYEFFDEFQGIWRSTVDGMRGEVYWTGKWIPFIESIFQMYCLPTRGIQVPTSIVSMKIDPRMHLTCVRGVRCGGDFNNNYYGICKSMSTIVDTVRGVRGEYDVSGTTGVYPTIPVCCDPFTRCYVAGGVEICGLTTVPWPTTVTLPFFPHQPTILERISFVPYFEKRGVDEEYCYPEGEFRQRYEQMDSYLSELKWHLSTILRRLEYPTTYLPTCTTSTFRRPEVTERFMQDGHLLRLLSEISRLETDPQFVYKCKQILTDKFAYYNALHQDKMFNYFTNRHVYLKSFLDTVLENVPCQTISGINRPVIKILEFAPTYSSFGVKINKFLSTHPMVNIEYYYVPVGGECNEELFQEWQRTSTFPINKVEWNYRNFNEIPSYLKDFDLVMFNSSIGSFPFFEDKLMLKKWLQTVCDRVLTPRGFVYSHEYTNNFEIFNYLQRLEHLMTVGQSREFQSYKYQTEGEWRRLFEEIGYTPIGLKSDSILSSMFLYRRPMCTPYTTTYGGLTTPLSTMTTRDVEICISDIDCFKWIERVKVALADSTVDRIWLINERVPTSGLIGMVNCLRKETRGDRIRCVFVVDNCKTVQPWTQYLETLKRSDLVMNVYKNGKWGSYRHLFDTSDIEQPFQFKDNIKHAYVNWMRRGDISTLNWMQSPEPLVAGVNQILCDVSYAGLNYRDYLLASGRCMPEHIPSYQGVYDHVFGQEFSGVYKNRRYMGVTPFKGIATTVVADTRYCWDIPSEWTLEQGCTVPLSYAIAYYSLLVKGCLRRGETVFIHSGCTPIGQAAIAIALAHDCRVFVSVQTPERRQFLMQTFPRLTEECFTGCDDVVFEKHIQRWTKGCGVDVVFNTLPYQVPSLVRVVVPTGGRFMDMCRYETGVRPTVFTPSMLKNIIYHNIVFDQLFETGCHDWSKVYKLVEEGIRCGVVRPLRSTVFDRYQVQDAFKQFVSDRIFGKCLIKVWEPKEYSTPTTISAVPRMWFSPYLSYVIVDGVSPMGLELAQWMVTRGARKLVLTTPRSTGVRSGFTSGYVAKRIQYLQECYGAIVNLTTYDIKDEGECLLLVKDAMSLSEERRIGGIFCVPTMFEEGTIETLTSEKYKQFMESRYMGAYLLDKYTRSMDGCLFVVFSTLSSGRGFPGHSVFSHADSSIERLCELRRVEGRHAIAIQCGSICDSFMTVQGTVPQKIQSWLSTLERVLLSGDRCTIWSSYVPSVRCPITSSYVTVCPTVSTVTPTTFGSTCVYPTSTYGGVYKTTPYPTLPTYTTYETTTRYQSFTPSTTVPTTWTTTGCYGGVPSLTIPSSVSMPTLSTLPITTVPTTLYETVVRLLGYRDSTSTRFLPLDKTLVELGITVSMISEIRRVLETYYRICMTEEEIQRMTIERIRSIDETRSYMRQYSNGGFGVPKYNYLMPRRVFERLNTVEPRTGIVPVVVIHPIEGHVNMLRNWAKHMKFPVYGVQFTSDALQCETIEHLAEYYWQQLENEFKTIGKFHLMGYSYGSTVAYEMACKKYNRIATLTFLDGSHTYNSTIPSLNVPRVFGSFKVTPDIESELLYSFISQYTQIPNRVQFIKCLMSMGCLEERIKYTIKEVLGTTQFSFEPIDIEMAARSFIRKMIMAYRYQPQMPLRVNEIFLVKPTIRGEWTRMLGEDYGLGQVFSGKIRTHIVDGDQRTFLESGNGYKVATILNDYFMQYF